MWGHGPPWDGGWGGGARVWSESEEEPTRGATRLPSSSIEQSVCDDRMAMPMPQLWDSSHHHPTCTMNPTTNPLKEPKLPTPTGNHAGIYTMLGEHDDHQHTFSWDSSCCSSAAATSSETALRLVPTTGLAFLLAPASSMDLLGSATHTPTYMLCFITVLVTVDKPVVLARPYTPHTIHKTRSEHAIGVGKHALLERHDDEL